MTVTVQATAALRALYPAPPDITFDGGLLCPVDICHAPLHHDAVGWKCTGCPGRWDRKGGHGSWDENVVVALAREVGVIVESAPLVVVIDPTVRPGLLLGWAAVLTGPGVALYATGHDLAGYADAVPAGPVYAA